MIVTLTPNPSLDLLFQVGRLVWDDANRTPPPRRRPGGQGINVVRAARAIDPAVAALAVAPLAGTVGRELRAMLEAEGTPIEAVEVGGETRVFVGARESETGRSLLLNPRGPEAGEAEADALIAAVERALDARAAAEAAGPDASLAATAGGPAATALPRPWVACCGSLLPGLPVDFYGRVGRLARDRGARFVVDCDGDALAAAVDVAHLIVPNEMEAARLVGRALGTPAEAAAAARELLDAGPTRVVITLGDRGAVSASEAGAWWARPRPPAELARALAQGSAVGAGDAFLAGLLLADEGAEAGAPGDEPTGLVRAVATGTAALLGAGAALVEPGDVEKVLPHVSVERLES